MSGESSILEVIVATQGRIRALVASSGVPLGDVDDVAQEVYLAYYKGEGRKPADVPVLKWLRGIAHKRCQDYFRRRGRVMRHWHEIGKLLEGGDDSALERVETEEVRLRALAGCIEGLPERQRRLLRWYYTESMSAEDVGRRLGRSAGAVRVIMLRIRDALRDCVLRRVAGEPG